MQRNYSGVHFPSHPLEDTVREALECGERERASVHSTFWSDALAALERLLVENRNAGKAWQKLVDDEIVERQRLERALRFIWRLPPGPGYHDRVGEVARRALEPGMGIIDALSQDEMIRSALSWELKIRKSSTHPWNEPVANLLRSLRDTLAIGQKESPAEAGPSAAE